MNKVETAQELFSEGYNCAQSVIAAYGPDLGMDEPTCLAISSMFGGGFGRQGEVCGAVSGALMALGLKYGEATVGDPGAKSRMYEYAHEFISKFKERHESIICRQLLGCDISTPEGSRQVKEQKLSNSLCAKFVRDAAEILETML